MMWIPPLPRTTVFCLPFKGSALLKGLATVPYERGLTEEGAGGWAGWLGQGGQCQEGRVPKEEAGREAGSQPQIAAYRKADVSGLAFFWKR